MSSCGPMHSFLLGVLGRRLAGVLGGHICDHPTSVDIDEPFSERLNPFGGGRSARTFWLLSFLPAWAAGPSCGHACSPDFHSPVANGAECVFTCLLITWVSPSGKCLLESFTHLKQNYNNILYLTQ